MCQLASTFLGDRKNASKSLKVAGHGVTRDVFLSFPRTTAGTPSYTLLKSTVDRRPDRACERVWVELSILVLYFRSFAGVKRAKLAAKRGIFRRAYRSLYNLNGSIIPPKYFSRVY